MTLADVNTAPLDGGYGRFKFIRHLPGGKRQYMSIPAAVARKKRGAGQGVTDRLDVVEVTVNDTAYEVGPDALLAMGRERTSVLHEGYLDTDGYMALHLGALYYMQVRRVKVLGVGLPVSLANDRRQDLVKMLEGTHRVGDRQIVVDKVVAAEQPLAGLIYYGWLRNQKIKDQPAWLPPSTLTVPFNQRQILGIDPGMGTWDWYTIKGHKTVRGMCGSHPCSIGSVLADIGDQLGGYKDLYRIDAGLREGTFTDSGQVVDLQPKLEKALLAVQPSIDTMLNSLGDIRYLDEIVVMGGGVIFLDMIKKAFPGRDVFLLGSTSGYVTGNDAGQKPIDRRRGTDAVQIGTPAPVEVDQIIYAVAKGLDLIAQARFNRGRSAA